jgi:gliding motility-associated-like protein
MIHSYRNIISLRPPNHFLKSGILVLVFLLIYKTGFGQCGSGFVVPPCNPPFIANISNPSSASQGICLFSGNDSIAIKNTSVGLADSVVFCWPFGSPAVEGFSGNFTGVLKRKIPYNPDTVCVGVISSTVMAAFYQNCSGTMTKVGEQPYTFYLYPKPSSAFYTSPNDSLCLNNQPFNFNINCALQGLVTYHWNFGDPTTLADTSNSSNPSYSYSAQGTYTVTCTARHTVCNTSTVTQRTVVVGGIPNPIINAVPFFFCSNGQSVLNAGAGYTNYLWSTGATTQSISVTTAGNYTVTVTNSFGCSASTDTAVSVFPQPNPIIIGDISICQGSTATLDAGAGFTSYVWSTGETSQVINPTTAGNYTVTVTDGNGCSASTTHSLGLSNTVLTNITGVPAICSGAAANLDAGPGYATYLWSTSETTQVINPTAIGSYSVTVTDANGCTGTSSVIVSAMAVPTPNITGINIICQGDLTTFDAGGGYSSYLWSTSEVTQSISPTTPGLYSVIVTNSAGCSGTASYTLTINPSPIASISGTLSICQNDLATATLNAGSGFSSYAWSTGETTQTISPSATGIYTVTVSNINSCTASTNINFTINNNPTPPITGITAVCQGNPATLNGGVFASYLWSTGETTQEIFPTIAGSYSVVVTDANGCTGTASANVTVSSNPTPIINGNANVCQGDSTIFDAGGGYNSYTWSNGSNSQMINVSTAGNYTVTVTNSAGCSGSTTNALVVNPNPTPTISGTTSICQNFLPTAILDAGPGYTTYAWSNGASTQSILPALSGNYSVIVSNGFSCTSSANVFFLINNNPVPSINGSDSICQGTAALLTANAGYTSYLWSTLATTQTIIPTTSGIYSVTVTDANGCTGTASRTLVVNPLPNPSISGTSPICDGLVSTLDAGGGYTSYLWSTGSSSQTIGATVSSTYFVTVTNIHGCAAQTSFTLTVNATPIPSISGDTIICNGSNGILYCGPGFNTYSWSTNAITQNISVNTAGAYSVTVTNVNGCSGTATQNVTVNQLPNPVIIGNPIICFGNSSQLTVGAGYSSYLWSTGASSPSISATSSGNYSVIVTNNNNCSNTGYFYLTVNPNPTPVIVGATSFCYGQNATLDCGGGFQNYSWSTLAITQSINVNSSGIYTVTVTDNNGCTGAASHSVIVNPLPQPFISGNSTGCFGSSSLLDAGSGYSGYSWSNGATTQTINASSSGTYTVTVTDNLGCTANASFLVTIFPNPIPIVTGVNPICYGTSTILSCSAGYQNYQWSSGENTQSIIVNSAGNYSVTVTDTNLCIGTSSPFQVVVNYATSVITASNSNHLCPGTSVTLTANPGLSYIWSEGSTTQNITVGTTGSYFVTVIDSNGCSAVSQILHTYLHDNPHIDYLHDTIFNCDMGYGINITNYSVADSGSSYLWDFGDGNSSLLFAPVHYYKVSGNYLVKLTIISPYGCTSVDSFLVNASFNPPAIADFIMDSDVQFIFGSPINFTDLSVNAVQWYWNFGDGNTSMIQNPTNAFKELRTYEVTLEVKNQDGCKKATTKKINTSPFIVPNAFTPNGDGKNDTFFATYNGLFEKNNSAYTYHMQIFDRWGELIFESKNYDTNWDGTYRGLPAKNDVYVWLISATNGVYTFLEHGTVTLVR